MDEQHSGLGAYRLFGAQSHDKVVAFHWPYPPARIAPLLPDGLVPDVFESNAWVGLVASVRAVRPRRGLPPPPWFGSWREVSVRTHVRGPDGSGGIYCLSVLTDRRAPRWLQRSVGVPARRGRIHLAVGGNVVVYEVQRRRLRSEIAVEVGDPLPPERTGAVERFVSGERRRYGAGRHGLWVVEEETHADDLYLAEPLHLEDDLVAASGAGAPDAAPVVLYRGRMEVRASRRIPFSAPRAASKLRFLPPPALPPA